MLTVSRKIAVRRLMLAFVIASALLITSVMPPTATAQQVFIPVDVCAIAKDAAWRFVHLWVATDEAIWKSPLTKVGVTQLQKKIMGLEQELKGSLIDHARLLQAASEKCPHFALELITDEAWALDLRGRDIAEIWNSYQNILKP